MTSFIVTPLVGGADGEAFNDLDKLTQGGHLILNMEHPITQIQLRVGWIVDGIQIMYNPSPLKIANPVCLHGRKTEGDPATFTIDLKPSENIVSVFGRAGEQSYYKRKMVNSIGFTIFDKETATTRIAGPFGNANKSNDGKPFSTGDVAAFAGYAKPGNGPLDLSGLSFISNAALV